MNLSLSKNSVFVKKWWGVKNLFLITLAVIAFTPHSFAQNIDPFAQKPSRVQGKSEDNKKIKPLDFSSQKNAPSQKRVVTPNRNFQLSAPLSLKPDTSVYLQHLQKNGKDGLPIFISSKAIAFPNQRTALRDHETISWEYLQEIRPLIRIENPENEFQIKNTYTDREGFTHIKMQQQYKGVKVHGREVILHLKDDHVSHFNGRNIPTPLSLNTEASLTAAHAMELANTDLGRGMASPEHDEHIFNLHTHTGNDFSPELVIYPLPDGMESRLVWHVTAFPNILERWEYFIDAHSGEIVDKYYHTCTIDGPSTGLAEDLNGVEREINTYIVSDVHFLVDASKPMFNELSSTLPNSGLGVIRTLDLRNEPFQEGSSVFNFTSTDNTWNDASAVSAHFNAEVSYQYFLNTFGRNSINGSGGNIISIVNVADDDGGGFDNAFWNGVAIFYGNGKNAFKPLAGSLDVGGHEMTHGVISSTANLEYRNQSGAINESFADIFAAMIDRDDWLIGEDIVTGVFPSGAMRSLEDPHNGGTQIGHNGFQPKHTSEMFTGSQDNGGVHVNSGITNHAFFLFATEVNKDVAEQIYYRALTVYLTVSSQFIDLRLAVIQSAIDLHGSGSPIVQAARDAFDAVGILDDDPTDVDPELPPLEGEDLVLFYDMNEADPTTLYIYHVDEDDFTPVSQTELFRKPSVTENGELALFISADKTIRYIELTGSFEENEISEEPIWTNVAISKDGTKAAAITEEEDATIYVFDLVNETFDAFELYNPTTAEGLVTGEVLYADAIEWDFSGEYLMYDALNLIPGNEGEDISYWDVGFIRVWDNEADDFGDGDIQKLFSTLPEGISIGNPSFSKNSERIVVFDVVDALEEEYFILTVNIETNDQQVVWNNSKLGFPNYSRLDDKIIFDSFDQSSNDVIAIVEMEDDKVTPQNNPTIFINEAQWSQWFTQGSREVLSSGKNMLSFGFEGLEEEIVGVISGNTISLEVTNEPNLNSLVATFTHSEKATVRIGNVQQVSGVTPNNFTNPVVYTVVAQDGTTKNYTVNVGNIITGIDDNIASKEVLVYPNPFTDNISVEFRSESSSGVKIELMNTIGRTVKLFQISNVSPGKNRHELPIDGLTTGTYILRVESSEGVVVQKLVKR